MNIIETDRLILRLWRESDAEAFYRINSDEKVIEFLPGPLTMQQVTDFMAVMNQQWQERHYTLWAAEEKASGKLAGFIGLSWLDLSPVAKPAVEIGWRLGSEFWGRGLATEGAMAAKEWGFQECGLDEIVAITVPANLRSQRVMAKLGMQRNPGADFPHPRLPADHRLSQHILFAVQKSCIR
jgi:RimJ/RimL family protein N-acetyltransferase